MRMTLESQLCACTKNFLFSGPALLDQWSLQFINNVLINCKKKWYNKAGTENRTFFIHAHNSDSGGAFSLNLVRASVFFRVLTFFY